MKTTRVTVRNVDQEVIDRVRIHIRTYGLSLGGVVTAALADHMESLEHYGLVAAGTKPPFVHGSD